MDKIPDNRGLITREMSEILHERMTSYGGAKLMNDMYAHIIKSEPHCSKDIENIVLAYNKTLIKTIIATLMQSPQVNDELIENLSIPVMRMLQNLIGVGAIYSQAKMEQDFVNSLEITDNESIDFMLDENLLIQEAGLEEQDLEDGDDDGDVPIK